MSTSLEDVPIEVLINCIWSKLSLLDIYLRARYVCKNWNQNIERSVQSLDVSNRRAPLPGRYTWMRKREWQESKFLSHVDPKQITGELKIVVDYPGGPEYINELLSHFKYVSKLDISAAHPEGSLWGLDHAIAKLEHLQEVKIRVNDWLFDENVDALLIPKLVHLSLDYDSERMVPKYAASLTKLRTLKVDMSNVSPVLKQLTSLESLRLTMSDYEDVESWPPHLHTLKLIIVSGGTIPNFEGLAKSVRHLSLVCLERVERLPDSLKLSSLELVGCHQDLVSAFAPVFPQLDYFKFLCEPAVVLDVDHARFLSNITTLGIVDCPSDSPLSLDLFPRLQHLHYETKTAIPVLMQPSLAMTPLLRSFHLVGPTEPAILVSLAGLVHLETITISFSMPTINDEEWQTLASLKSLRSISLNGLAGSRSPCRSEADVYSLCSSLPQLSWLCLIDIVSFVGPATQTSVQKELIRKFHLQAATIATSAYESD
jgi:hypothetical protein